MAQDTTPKDAFVFNLDTVENERKDEKLFVAEIEGRKIAFINPKDVDWRDLAELGDDPAEFVELCVEDEGDAEWLMSQALPSWKMEKLIEAFTRHYGIGGRRGNRRGSRR